MKRLALTLTILLGFALGGVAQSVSFNFEDGTLQGWTTLDGDGDGHNWELSVGGMGHNSDGMVMSYSKDYATGDSLTPNEYLVSPRLVLNEWPVIRFYACALDESYPAEHFGVSISTTVNNDPLAFTLLSEWTIAAKDAGNRQGNWYNYTVDLSAYTGQEVYVAIRHHYCSGQSAICVDDIQIDGTLQQDGLIITPSTLSFEAFPESHTVNILNNTDAPVTINSAHVDQNDLWVMFWDLSNLPVTLQPGQSIDFELYLNAYGYKSYYTATAVFVTSIGNRYVPININEEAWDDGLLVMPMQGLYFNEQEPLTQYFYLHNTNALQSITVYEVSEGGSNYFNMVPSHELPYVIPGGGSFEVTATLVDFPENATEANLHYNSSDGEANIPFFHIAGGLSGGDDYHPIVEDGKQWNVLFSYPWNPPEPQHKYTDIYKTEGDTLVDGVSYKVMYTTKNEDLTGWSVCGVIRETEDKQVLYRRDGSSYDEILYDFSMEVGDTIIMNGNGFYPDMMFVVETNEILVGGEPRQQIVLEYPWGDQEIWIEGIGSLYGIIDSGSLFLTGGSTNLLCYYEDGDLIWNNTTSGYDQCYIVNPNPQGDLVITPDTLWFESCYETQAIHIINQTNNPVTISDIEVQDNNMLIVYATFPQTLQPNQSTDIEVEVNAIGNKGYQTAYINIVTSIGTRQVVIKVNDEVWNGLVGGSEWYYEIQNEDGGITYQYLYQANDTVVGDEPSHILVKINTLYDKGLHEEVTHEYIFERDSKVYWWNKTLEEFTVLYNFGADAGESWNIKVGTETLAMHVDAVEYIEYEGISYRVLHVSDPDDFFSGDIVCGIGHLTSFFPERLMDNGDGVRVEGLRCYWIEDELVFKIGDEDCDAIYEELHGVEENAENQFNVYPNPTHGVLFVETFPETSLQDQTYRITNLTGQTLMTGQITTETQQIDVSGLPQGMYFVSVGGRAVKFVKH